ncbi:MAG: hypothetical protein RBS57_04035, partial [Desulforhabdus sp.]|nr:hypothetical protein [Desulforhabdus sp.]
YIATLCLSYAAIARYGRLTGVGLIDEKDAPAWVVGNQLFCCLLRVVGATVVNDNDFEIFVCLSNNAFNAFLKVLTIIVAGNDH